MPPLVIWRAGKEAEVTAAHLKHYSDTAPGCGLVVVEATAVSPEGRLAASQLGLFEDRHIPGMQQLAAAIRACGALPGIQLHHAGAKTDIKKTWGETPLTPSPVPGNGEVRELTEDDILRIIEDFAAAARRAVEAGFDLLEIHGAHGYLGSQFLSPRTNRRTDRWGGSLENRAGFLREVVLRIREAVGESAVLSCRLGLAEGPPAKDAVGAAAGPGLTVAEGIRTAQILVEAGLRIVHVSHAGGRPEPLERHDTAKDDSVKDESTTDTGTAADSSFVPDAVLQLARPVREALSVPVIGVGGVITAENAEAALARGYCDLVAVGRAMLADPAWACKITEGVPETIELCRRCEPRCHHFREPEKCPTRKRLGIGPPGL